MSKEVTSGAAQEIENPKDKFGKAKPGVSSIPPVALAMLGQAMAEGERKYGLTNWRGTRVEARLYYDAAQRHLMAWLDGQDTDPDSGLPHLALAMAGLCIILDGQQHGKLVDNRTEFPGTFPVWMEQNTRVKSLPVNTQPLILDPKWADAFHDDPVITAEMQQRIEDEVIREDLK